MGMYLKYYSDGNTILVLGHPYAYIDGIRIIKKRQIKDLFFISDILTRHILVWLDSLY